jgi:hypothetical protein
MLNKYVFILVYNDIYPQNITFIIKLFLFFIKYLLTICAVYSTLQLI